MKCVSILAVLVSLLAACSSRAEENDLTKTAADVWTAAKKGKPDEAAVKALLQKAIAALFAEKCATDESARKDPQNALDKIEFVVSRPNAEAERETYCKTIAESVVKAPHVPAKIWLLKSLERIGKAESLAAETALLADPDETVRETARRAIALNPSDESSAILRKGIESAADPKTRVAMIGALAFKRSKADASIFEKEAQSADASVKTAALAALQAQGIRKEPNTLEAAAELVDMGRAANAADIPKLIAAFDSPNIRIRRAAIQAVNFNKSPDMTKALTDKFIDKASSRDTRSELLLALASRGDKSALPAIVSPKNNRGDLFLETIVALGYLGDASVVDPLMAIATFNKKQEGVQAARDALDRLKGDGVDAAIAKVLEKSDSDGPKEAVKRLIARNATSMVPALLKMLDSTDANLRAETLKGLGGLGGKDAIAPILAVLTKTANAGERDAAAKAIVSISRRLPESAGHLDAIIDAAKSAPEIARVALLNGLSQIGGAKALDVVRAAQQDASDAIKEAAFRALASWSDAAPINELLDIAKTTKVETHRVLALRGFVRLAGLSAARQPKETLAQFASAKDAIKTPEDRKLLLGAMGEIKDVGAVSACADFIADATVSEEACVATVKVAKNFENGHNDAVAAAMKAVLEKVKNKQTKEQAQAILDKQTKH